VQGSRSLTRNEEAKRTMTNKFMFDESSHVLHRVVGYTHTWEQLAPGIRVRRRRVQPLRDEGESELASWVSTFSASFDGFVPGR
jgi:hypothetical protein